MEMSRGASISIQLRGERDCPEVVVEDASGSMVTVRVPIALPDDWIADHRQRLHRVMNHWVPMLQSREPRCDIVPPWATLGHTVPVLPDELYEAEGVPFDAERSSHEYRADALPTAGGELDALGECTQPFTVGDDAVAQRTHPVEAGHRRGSPITRPRCCRPEDRRHAERDGGYASPA
ncbi:DUF5959 family protein [Streptomyces siamensis]|uniref:Uncharacterized protein n=1 Tax=Streptomyces siamensis TaxID=1274986 RepID=A0ABP9J6W7_9ACTN